MSKTATTQKKKLGKHVQIYQTRAGRFSFRVIAGNGENVGNPSGSYAHRRSARKAARREHQNTTIVSK